MAAEQHGQALTGAERLETLAREYRPALRRYFGKRADRHADVEDLVQDVLVRLAVRGDCDTIEQPEAYLMRTATNVWRDFLRKKRTHAEEAHDAYIEGYVLEENGPAKSWRADSRSMPSWRRWPNCRNARVRFLCSAASKVLDRRPLRRDWESPSAR